MTRGLLCTLPVLSVLVACEDSDPLFDDGDGDGFSENIDCDDADPDINPAATETCDGIDNDCDNLVDGEDDSLDGTLAYLDEDQDGFGADSSVAVVCSIPEGYSDVAGDCDDLDHNVNPYADEICDGIDNDCDQLVDADDDSLTNGERFLRDRDGDGWGDDQSDIIACEQPAGYVQPAVGGDCDDTDPSFHPYAEETCTDQLDYNCDGSVAYADVDEDGWAACEDCNDNDASINPDALEYCDLADNDCDGTIDEFDAVDAVSWWEDVDGDGFGDPSSTLDACTQPVGFADNDQDCNDADFEINPDAAEVCLDGVDNNCDGSEQYCEIMGSSTDRVFLGPDAFDEAGLAVSAGEDIDGDGYAELAIGARGDDENGTDAGAAYVLFGPLSSASSPETLDTVSGHKLLGEDAADYFGRTLAFVGDVTGDGEIDLAVSAPVHDAGGVERGASYVVSGSKLGTGSTEVGADLAVATFFGSDDYDYAGIGVVGGGDVDGDSQHDLWVGSSGHDDLDGAGPNVGAVELVLGPVTADASLATAADATLWGVSADNSIGGVLATGDVDGDGLQDLVVGDAGDSEVGTDAGAAFIVLGDATGMNTGIDDADMKLLGEATGDTLGASLAGIGDVDGDGLGDLFIGAPNANRVATSAGAAYLVAGSTSTGDMAGDVATAADGIIQGYTAGDGAGSAVDGGVDFTGDGEADYAVGAKSHGDFSQGAAYLVAGPLSGTTTLELASGGALARIVGDDVDDELGHGVALAGSIAPSYGQGMVATTPSDETKATDQGAVSLFFGP